MNNSQLWMEFKSSPSSELKKRIVVNYIKLVHYVIHKSKFLNLNVLEDKDYFQFGIEGLSEAIDRYDPNVGTKFETYAIQRIRGKIIDEIRKLQIKPRITAAKPNEIMYSNVSLSSSYNDEEGYMLSETIPSDAETPDQIFNKKEAKEVLLQAMQELEERDRLILSLYYYEELNYKEIANTLDITVSRVSQVHTKILKQLKAKIEKVNA
jgi:RNA polymerase sigma factor FliA